MILKMIFDSEIDDDMAKFRMADCGKAMYCAIEEINRRLRAYDKHGHSFKDADEAVEKIRGEVNSVLHEYKVDEIF